MFKKRSDKRSTVTGLELDPSHVAAAEVNSDGELSVRRSGVAMLRPGVMRDGELTDPEALTETLRTLFADRDLPTRVRLGVATQRVVVRTMDLPPLLDERGIAEAVQEQAADHIPMPIEEAVVDFQSLGIVQTPTGPQTRVVIVAVRREMVERLARAAQDAGLTVDGIDLSAFAMVRAVGTAGQGARLYVNVAGLVNVAVANEHAVLFARSAAGGVEAIAQALAERRSLTLEHARQWMIHVGLETPLEQVEGDADLVAATRATLTEGVSQIADAIRSSLEFHRMQNAAETVSEGVLCGPAIAIAGFAEALGEQLRLPIRAASVAPEAEDGPVAEAGRITVAAGLAVEERELTAA